MRQKKVRVAEIDFENTNENGKSIYLVINHQRAFLFKSCSDQARTAGLID